MKKRALISDLKEDIFSENGLDKHPVENFVADQQDRIINISIDQIQSNPEQPRKYFNQEALDNLAESIKTRGLLQPIIIKKTNDNSFVLVAGERRWRACKIVGLKKIQAVVSSDNEMEIALIENMQRENLSAIEEAEGLHLLAQKFKYTHEQLSKIINKSRTSITEVLSLNNLLEPIKEECRTSDIYSKSVLLHIVRQKDKDKMMAFWKQVKSGKLTVKQSRKLAKSKTDIKVKTPVESLVEVNNKFIKQANKKLNEIDLNNITDEEKDILKNNFSLLGDYLQNLLEKFG